VKPSPSTPNRTRQPVLSRSVAALCPCGAAAAREAENKLLSKGKKLKTRYKHYEKDCPANKGSQATQARKDSKKDNP
jgi:hypothetical protein